MDRRKTKEPDTTNKYVVIVSDKGKGSDNNDVLSAISAVIYKYNADILDTAQEKFEGRSITYIIIDIKGLQISVNEFSNRLWLRGNDLGYKAYLKREKIYLTWVREQISIL